MNKLVLFDIDGTLIKGSEGHKKAFAEAFRQIYKVDTGIEIIDYHGKTDQQIIFEVLSKKGLGEEKVKEKLIDCMLLMIESAQKEIEGERIEVLPGVVELVDELKERGILVGLVSGNLEPIARLKLRKVGLNDYFPIGGFGSDVIERDKLVDKAITRSESHLEFKQEVGNVYLVGDTPLDVEAGNKVGVTTIGVATGAYDAAALKEAGSDHVLNDLTEKESFLGIVL